MRQSRPVFAPDVGYGAASGASVPRAGAQAAIALRRAIAGHVVPRLVVARAATPIIPTELPVSAEAAHIAELSMADDPAPLQRLVSALHLARGLESACLEVLAPAARHLGALWNDDQRSFTDVTVGMGRLQTALRELSHAVPLAVGDAAQRRRILISVVPGEDHIFGASMLGVMFRQAGWVADTLYPAHERDIIQHVRREWFAVLAISVGHEGLLGTLSAMLPRLRDASRNQSIAVMVGGPVLVGQPGIARQLGADTTAVDGAQAVWHAENLLSGATTCC